MGSRRIPTSEVGSLFSSKARLSVCQQAGWADSLEHDLGDLDCRVSGILSYGLRKNLHHDKSPTLINTKLNNTGNDCRNSCFC